MSKCKLMLSALLSALFLTPCAQAGVDISAPSTGWFALLGTLLQDLVNFLDGPWALAMIIISIIVMVCMWIWAPKDGAMGVFMKICVGAIVILNIPSFLALLQ